MRHRKWKKCEECEYVMDMEKPGGWIFCTGFLKKKKDGYPHDITRFCFRIFEKGCYHHFRADFTPAEAYWMAAMLGFAADNALRELFPQLLLLAEKELAQTT